MEKKIEALCLKAEEYKESDKLLTLLGAEGKFKAVARGVRRSDAKLKSAAQPFCFAEYELTGKGDFFTVIGADIKEGFYRCWEEVECYGAASCICAVADSLTFSGGDTAQEMALTVKALGAVEYGEGSPKAAYLWYLVSAAGLVGSDFALCSERHRKLFTAIGKLHWDEVGTMELTEGEVSILTEKALENIADFIGSPSTVRRAMRLAGI